MDMRKSIKAVARGKAAGGMFQAALQPVDVLDLDDIAEKWASYSGVRNVLARSTLMGLEDFIIDQLAKGFRLDFGLVSFYPRLSGGLSSRDADPEADGLFVRGAVKARRKLVNGLKNRLQAENAQGAHGVRIFSVFDASIERYGVVVPGHVLSISGTDIEVNPENDDEGIWLEKRTHHTARRRYYEKIARARVLKSDANLVEAVFDEPIQKGTYLLSLYTRQGRGTDFQVIHCRSEVKVR